MRLVVAIRKSVDLCFPIVQDSGQHILVLPKCRCHERLQTHGCGFLEWLPTQKLTLGKGGDLDSCSDSFIAMAMSFSSCCLGVKPDSFENTSDRLGAG